MVSVAILWFLIKPSFTKAKEAKRTKREFTQLKFNTEIFETLLKKQKEITSSPEGLGITIGNPVATNTIVKICNPYCTPCSKVHPELEKLLETNNDLKVQIIFMVTANKDDKRNKPVRHLLAIAAKQNELNTRHALNDWYLQNNKDYEAFANKHPLNGELKLQDDKIVAMEAWCVDTGITNTPTIFINGRQLPRAYSVEDIGYFLL
jgi:protein-disulfide isomerase